MNNKQMIKSAHFIDPKWSLGEVKEFLKETVFSSSNLAPIRRIVTKNLKYKGQYVQWTTHRKEDEYFKIFNPLPYQGNYPVKLNVIPYWGINQREIDVLCFAVVKFQKSELIAVLIDNEVIFYTHHCVDRYAERYFGNLYSERGIDMIGEMFIYNNFTYVQRTKTISSQIYDIVRDVMFICRNE